MRKLIDSIFIFLLKIAVGYLKRYYEFVLDGFELWIAEKLPGLDDVLDDSDDYLLEE